MAQIPKGRLVKGPYKPICTDCAIYFSTTVLGGFDPFETYYTVKLDHFPMQGENKRYLKPPRSIHVWKRFFVSRNGSFLM